MKTYDQLIARQKELTRTIKSTPHSIASVANTTDENINYNRMSVDDVVSDLEEMRDELNAAIELAEELHEVEQALRNGEYANACPTCTQPCY